MLMELMRSSVNIRKTGGLVTEAISTSRGKITSFQNQYERYQQSARWLSGSAEQKGWNIYGVRLPGMDLRQDYHDLSPRELELLGATDQTHARSILGRHEIRAGEQFDVFTLDIETTGLVPSSETREISMLKRTGVVDESGNMTWLTRAEPENVRTWHMKTTGMNSGIAVDAGEKVNLSELAFRQQGVDSARDTIYSWLDGEGSNAETVLREIFDEVLGKSSGGARKTRFTLHNNNFDIDFLHSALLQRFDKLQPETVDTLTRFAQRRAEDPFFVVDSLNALTAKLHTDVHSIFQGISGVTDASGGVMRY